MAGLVSLLAKRGTCSTADSPHLDTRLSAKIQMEVCFRSLANDPATNFNRVLSLLLLWFFLVGGLCLCLLRPSAAQDEPAASSPPVAVEAKSPKDAAQEPATPPAPEVKPQEQTGKTATKNEKKKKEHRGSILIAPLPLVSPAIGTGLIPIVGYIFPCSKSDKVSLPSTIGGGGLITNNGTVPGSSAASYFSKKTDMRSRPAMVAATWNTTCMASVSSPGMPGSSYL